MPDHIVLIAPPRVDLTAAGEQLAHQLGLPLTSPDDFSMEDWEGLGYDSAADTQAFAHGGAFASFELWQQTRLQAVETLLADPERSVIVLSPTYVVYTNPLHQAAFNALLANIPHVMLLTPTDDPAQNARLLNVDLTDYPDWSEVNAYWVRNPSNERLAKHIVYTHGKTEDQTRDEILALVGSDARDVILIGPKLTGKTTIGSLLAGALKLPQVSLDDIGGVYLSETDFESALARQARQKDGLFGFLRYMRPYEAHIVERALEEHSGFVMDFGGGHSVYEEEEDFQRVERALAPYPHVILLLPAPGKDESIAILRERFDADVASERRLHRLLVTDGAYEVVAKQRVYTNSKLVEAWVTEIMQTLAM